MLYVSDCVSMLSNGKGMFDYYGNIYVYTTHTEGEWERERKGHRKRFGVTDPTPWRIWH